MNILITICARGGSKGIPGKNIKIINGVPLIAYSIVLAKKLKEVLEHHVVIELSTDSQVIRVEASKYGLETSYERPTELASDTAGKVDALRDILLYAEKSNAIKFDYLLDLDVTSPFRTVEDILIGFDRMKADKNAYNLFSVSKPHRNPYFNVVEKKENEYFGLVKKSEAMSRQQAPKVYDINGSFYIYDKTFFEAGLRSAITERTLIFEMEHICFDLDEPIDFLFMEWILKNDQLDFTLLQP